MKIISKASSMFGYLIAVIIYWTRKLFYLIEFLLFIRLTLKFIGANPEAAISEAIYSISDIFVSPFFLMFEDIYWQGNLVESATLAAMIGYFIVAFILYKLVYPFQRGGFQ